MVARPGVSTQVRGCPAGVPCVHRFNGGRALGGRRSRGAFGAVPLEPPWLGRSLALPQLPRRGSKGTALGLGRATLLPSLKAVPFGTAFVFRNRLRLWEGDAPAKPLWEGEAPEEPEGGSARNRVWLGRSLALPKSPQAVPPESPWLGGSLALPKTPSGGSARNRRWFGGGLALRKTLRPLAHLTPMSPPTPVPPSAPTGRSAAGASPQAPGSSRAGRSAPARPGGRSRAARCTPPTRRRRRRRSARFSASRA